MTPRKIVFATFGSLGDVHPFLAIALALKARGHRPVVALLQEQAAKAEAAGLEALPIGMTPEQYLAETGLTEAEFMRSMFRDPGFVFERVIFPLTAPSAERVLGRATDADMVVGTAIAPYGRIVAESLRVPYVSCVLQPVTLLSEIDPPHGPKFGGFFHAPVGRFGAAWNRVGLSIVRSTTKRQFGPRIDEARRKFGLPPATETPLFEDSAAAAVRLALFPRLLAPLGVSPATTFAGFPVFDSENGRPQPLEPDLAAFLKAGPPPLIFTLGSFAVHAAGDFYHIAKEAARRLNRRSLLLVGSHWPDGLSGDDDCLIRAYAPHSQVFPAAAANIHHGGIGTVGAALRAGVPQLVVPHMADQFDNAARVARLGLGAKLEAKRLTVATATEALGALLADAAAATRAEAIAGQLNGENGAEAAADAIEAALTRT